LCQYLCTSLFWIFSFSISLAGTYAESFCYRVKKTVGITTWTPVKRKFKHELSGGFLPAEFGSATKHLEAHPVPPGPWLCSLAGREAMPWLMLHFLQLLG
jgi:hypothetical protein